MTGATRTPPSATSTIRGRQGSGARFQPPRVRRAADVLERNALCLFGTQDFTRSVASRMSNLALATNPASKIMSADSLLVAPDESMLLVHIVLPGELTVTTVPRVSFDDEETLSLRLETLSAWPTPPVRRASPSSFPALCGKTRARVVPRSISLLRCSTPCALRCRKLGTLIVDAAPPSAIPSKRGLGMPS